MDAEELIPAICAKIDEYQQRMEAIFDKSIQKIATNSSSSPLPTQISSSRSEEKRVLALEVVSQPGDGKEKVLNQQWCECHLQIGGQEVPVESVQEDSENLVKMADIVIAQDLELNIGINSGSQEKLGDNLAMNSQSSNNSGQENGEQIPSWYTVCIGKLANKDPNSEERDRNTLGKPPEVSDREIGKDVESIQFPGASFKVIPFPDLAKVVASDIVVAYRKPGELVEDPFECIEVGLSSAHNVFDKRPMRSYNGSDSFLQLNITSLFMGNWVFDPGDFTTLGIAQGMGFEEILMVEDALASDKTDSKHVNRAFSWEMDCSKAVGEMLGPVIVGNMFAFDPGVFDTSNCKYYGQLDVLERHLECYADRFDGFNEQVFEQASLKWEDCGLILILGSHCNGSKLMRSCEYDSRSVDRRVGDVISVFDPGIVCNNMISKFLSALATTWFVFGSTGDVTTVIAPSLPCDRGKLKLIIGKEGEFTFSYDSGKTTSVMTMVQSVKFGLLEFDGKAWECECFKKEASGRVFVFDPGGSMILTCTFMAQSRIQQLLQYVISLLMFEEEDIHSHFSMLFDCDFSAINSVSILKALLEHKWMKKFAEFLVALP